MMDNPNTNAPMKPCKHCKTMIPKGAKVCPNCRKKQGGIGKWIVIAIVVIIIIAIASSASGGKDEKVKKRARLAIVQALQNLVAGQRSIRTNSV